VKVWFWKDWALRNWTLPRSRLSTIRRRRVCNESGRPCSGINTRKLECICMIRFISSVMTSPLSFILLIYWIVFSRIGKYLSRSNKTFILKFYLIFLIKYFLIINNSEGLFSVWFFHLEFTRFGYYKDTVIKCWLIYQNWIAIFSIIDNIFQVQLQYIFIIF
jgi:hypothetical protein